MPKCDFNEVAKHFSNWFSLEVFFHVIAKNQVNLVQHLKISTFLEISLI